ncbi:hypothetical protein [Embleya sp. NPDC001921]
MSPEFVAILSRFLRTLGGFAERHDITETTLPDISAELDRARQFIRAANGPQGANLCRQHTGGPFDPGAENGCLLCWQARARPASPMPDDIDPADVARCLREDGQDAATARYGARAVTRALALGAGHPSTHQTEGETSQ